MQFTRKSDNRLFSDAEIRALLSLLSKLEQLCASVVRHGCDLHVYLDQFDRSTLNVPKYLARIRTGNDETFEFLTDDEARSRFYVESNLDDVYNNVIAREIEIDGQKRSQRITVSEIFEHTHIAQVLEKLKEIVGDLPTFVPNGEPQFTLRDTASNAKEADIPVATLADMIEAVRQLGRKGLHIQRYKGLGEMNPKQLFETTMDPKTRRMLKVRLEDVAEAEQTFSMLMGDDVPTRRTFIEDNALNVANLDI